jgi:hypothetical protein
MPIEVHARARSLIDACFVTGISLDENHWLDAHIGECPECSDYLDLSKSAVRGLGEFSFEMIPGINSRIQFAITKRAAELEAERLLRLKSLMGFVTALLLTTLGSLAAWESTSWISAYMDVTQVSLQVGVVVFWLLPSLGASLILLVMPIHRDDVKEEGQV